MYDIKCVLFGRVSCFMSYMFSRSNLCIYLKCRVDSFCGGGVVDNLCHSLSSGVASKGKFSILLLRWAPPATLIRYIVLVVGDLLQS
jgi:hypothetical protein